MERDTMYRSLVLLLLAAACCCARAAMAARLSHAVVTDPGTLEVSVSKTPGGDFSVVASRTGEPLRGGVGDPALPVRTIRFAVPAGNRVTGVVATSTGATVVDLAHPPLPVQPPVPLNGMPAAAFAGPKEASYRGPRPFPERLARLTRIGMMGGQMVAEVQLHMAQYLPATNQLLAHKGIVVSLALVPMRPAPDQSTGSVAPHFARQVATCVVNPIDVTPHPGRPLTAPADSDAVDYLIITGNAMVPAFSRLSEWRTRTGLRSRILTVESIAARYPGSDVQERIRRCIQDYRAHHGVTYVVLGGGAGIVPIRYVSWTIWPAYIPDLRIPTDLYYTDICDTSSARDPYCYNFDSNNNGAYGELGLHGDAIDLMPDVMLGRIPVDDPVGANAYVDKLLGYEQEPPQGFGSSVLLMADGPFAPLVDMVHRITLTQYAPAIDPLELYTPASGYGWSGDGQLTSIAARQQLTLGYNLVYHIDHAGVYSLGTGVGSGGGWLYRGDIAALGNRGRPSIVVTPSCSPNAFDHTSFASTLIGVPDGGAIAFIGNSRIGFVDQANQCRMFFTSLFRDRARHLGAAFQMMQYYSFDDYSWYGMNLMGDPAMPVWTGAPEVPSVSHTVAQTGMAKTVTVTVSGLSSADSAYVCLSKDDGIHLVEPVAIPAAASFDVTAVNGGFLYVTVTGRDIRPYRDSVPIDPSVIPPVRASTISIIDDEHGNGDGVANPGESFLAVPGLEFDTRRPVSRLTITATALSTGLDVCGDAVEPAIPPRSRSGAHPGSKDGFIVKLAPGIKSGNGRLSLSFQAVMPSSETHRWSQVVSMPVCADSLVHLSHRLVLSPVTGQETSVQSSAYAAIATVDSVVIANLGEGASGRAHVRLVTDTPDAVILDDATSLPGIGPGASATLASPLRIGLRRGTLPSPGSVQLVVTAASGASISRPLALPALPRPHTVVSSPVSGGIRITWGDSLPRLAGGYWVYRSQPGREGFIRVNRTLITGSRAFVDYGAGDDDQWIYSVAGVDLAGNTGPLTASTDTTSVPSASLPGFPVTYGIGGRGMRLWGSPAIGDIDGDGHPDIVMGSDDGLVYAFDRDGATLPGWPVTLGVQIDNSTPALADLDGDGIAEVIMGTGAWYTAAGDGLVHALKGDGAEAPGWPAPVSGDAFGSCAAADLDGDGNNEVIAATTAGLAYVWAHDGIQWPGWPVTVGDRVASSPAIGDVNGDGRSEIIVTATAGTALVINVLSSNGQQLADWPRTVPCNPGYALTSPALADIDGDRSMEIVQACGTESPNGYVKVHCLNADSSEAAGWPIYVQPNSSITASPAIGDLDGDGAPDVVICAGNGIVYAFSNAGMERPLWQATVGSNGRTNPVIADVDDDGYSDVLLTTESGYLCALAGQSGAALDGYPLWIESSWSAPAVTDLDGNGRLDLVATGWGSHRIFAWEMRSSVPAASVWSSYRGDNARTGCYHQPVISTAGGAQMKATTTRGTPTLLLQNYPNPVAGRTMIRYQTTIAGRVSLKVYNILGQQVATLLAGNLSEGCHEATWNCTDDRGNRVAEGTYLYRLETQGRRDIKRMVVIR